ncbi:Xaa-Pro aminopeptidase [Alphaproteobacteria bacterium]
MITALRSLFEIYGIEGYIVPVNDEWQNESPPPDKARLHWLTGFSGSNGFLLITQAQLLFYTDSRYILQAKLELSPDFTICDMQDHDAHSHLPMLLPDSKKFNIGYDPMLSTARSITYYEGKFGKYGFKVSPIEENLIDKIWKNKPSTMSTSAYLLDIHYTGLSSSAKIRQACSLIDTKSNYLLLTNPASICWLLNIRGGDIPYSPLLLTYLLLNKEGAGHVLFVEPGKIPDSVMYELDKLHIAVTSIHDVKEHFLQLLRNTQNIELDPQQVPIWFLNNDKDNRVIGKTDCCLLLKACKNKVELDGMRQAHLYDGIALCKFLCWLYQSLEQGKEISEIEASGKLLQLRQQEMEFQYPSFAAISAYGSHSAIVHYSATKDTNCSFGLRSQFYPNNENIYLFDSGGQYKCGTTDVTRTIAIGKPKQQHKDMFTAVLKGHILLASARFPINTTGAQLDSFARYYLWKQGSDYGHGTGHGVGHFLCVHEGPHNISKLSTQVELQPGMVVSIEPGYYVEHMYGIRIENLYIVKKSEVSDAFLEFEVLTIAPIDLSLVDFNKMNREEADWLNKYHDIVKEKLSPHLDHSEKAFLANSVQQIR